MYSHKSGLLFLLFLHCTFSLLADELCTVECLMWDICTSWRKKARISALYCLRTLTGLKNCIRRSCPVLSLLNPRDRANVSAFIHSFILQRPSSGLLTALLLSIRPVCSVTRNNERRDESCTNLCWCILTLGRCENIRSALRLDGTLFFCCASNYNKLIPLTQR